MKSTSLAAVTKSDIQTTQGRCSFYAQTSTDELLVQAYVPLTDLFHANML